MDNQILIFTGSVHEFVVQKLKLQTELRIDERVYPSFGGWVGNGCLKPKSWENKDAKSCILAVFFEQNLNCHLNFYWKLYFIWYLNFQ
jgi:hypothetical protein